MSNYRDYGTIGGAGKTGVSINTDRYSQVYQATHDGINRLPYMHRSFISFSYGGKPIEDFNLIATFSNGRLSKDGYASFDDTTTSYDNLDGQYYWSTHYKTNTLGFTLSTDGITEKELDNFLHWFRAGVSRQLILAEHPNRAIMARLASPPSLNLAPFEGIVNITISGVSYPTKTTLYKGEININFVMDEPHWYSVTNILGHPDNNNHYVDEWVDANGKLVSIFASTDALKILYEDGIPLGSMFEASMLLGNGMYANAEDNPISLIWDPVKLIGAKIDGGTGDLGVINGAIVDLNGNGISELAAGQYGYFFYSGTAPSPTTITFTLKPQLQSYFVVTPKNQHSNGGKYNTFKIASLTEKSLKFTTPNLLTSYNKVIEIFDTYINHANIWEDVYTHIREEVRHVAVRTWANSVLQYAEQHYTSNEGLIQNPNISSLKKYMSYMLYYTNISEGLLPMTVSFNSKNGEAIGSLNYRAPGGTLPVNDEEWKTFGQVLENQIEDVGDMLRSNYIIITERNYWSDSGKVVAWKNDNDQTKSYSHVIVHDVGTPLTNIQIEYKNMYL